ncbi:hypothetical protein LOTGIDRAFT_192130 [Lottia gigantea]|uniref:BAR domain-containing protein n=1 Tax=Lottia gigantea TaxID=225164 RepID=V3ZGR2_LOTGI|nr:hypothetical protein LOTGIDRAFT_192130 [Lottia gigantea]ESO90403.1 hypothetical protein LOTGIDRAFT_192130 [Lottia gigantea]
MSWNPFSRAAPRKSVISRTQEREFEKDVKKIEELDESSRKLYKDVKRWIEANNAVAKSERKISQDLLNSVLCQQDEELRALVEDWDKSVARIETHTHEMNNSAQKTFVDPMKKFSSIFPNVQLAVKRREQVLQEFQKCQLKNDKYEDRERTGQNRVKQEQSKKMLNSAREEFISQNTSLTSDIPKLIEGRIDYLQPSFEALVNSQVTYNTEAFKIYSELSLQMNDLQEISNEEYSARIQKNLDDMKSLSITVD